MSRYDDVEARSADQRETSLVARAAALPGYGLGQVDAAEVTRARVIVDREGDAT